jgi:hypothetical protein
VARKAVELFNTRVYDMIEEATDGMEQGSRDYRDAMARASMVCVRAAAQDIPGPGALAMINANDNILRADLPAPLVEH